MNNGKTYVAYWKYAQNLSLPVLGTDDVRKGKTSGILFPNPATDILNIKGSNDQKYEIYNAAGRHIQSGNIKDSKIPVQHFSKGVYYLKIKDQDQKYIFIKK